MFFLLYLNSIASQEIINVCPFCSVFFCTVTVVAFVSAAYPWVCERLLFDEVWSPSSPKNAIMVMAVLTEVMVTAVLVVEPAIAVAARLMDLTDAALNSTAVTLTVEVELVV